jgi:DNA ligase-1
VIVHPTAQPLLAPGSFDELARTCEEVAAESARSRKVTGLASFLRGLDAADQIRALRFLSGVAVETERGRKLALGHATLRDALLAASGWDLETVRLCYRETGDTGEAVSLLMNGLTRGEPLSLGQAEQTFLRLYQLRRTVDRVELLRETYRALHPLTLRYFVKVLTGSFRIGLQQRLLEEAYAMAVGRTAAEIREANSKTGDLARVARAVQQDALERIEARMFHPMEFMLAKPVEDAELGDAGQWVVEDKYDGIRSQVHVAGGEVRIFTRGLDDTTAAFPEIVEMLRGHTGRLVIDGEILAWREGRALPFTVLQQRIARKRVNEALRREIPVTLIAYDLLYRNGRLLLGDALEQRRAALEATGLTVSPQAPLGDLEGMFAAARARGNEGLLLKRRGSRYEAGKRSGEWLKVKRPYGTLDVVITAAEQGHGRRATVLSDYTFAVRGAEGFLNVGKAYSGLTDEEIRELTRLLRMLVTDRFGGRVLLVKPAVVLEVAFDGVQRSPRHKSGFALRFPRIVRWRRDKRPEECDTLATVQEMYERSLRAPE